MLNHEHRILVDKLNRSCESAWEAGRRFLSQKSSPEASARKRTASASANASEGEGAETEEEMLVYFDALAALRGLGVGETEAKRLMRSVPKPWPLDAGEMVAQAMRRRNK